MKRIPTILPLLGLVAVLVLFARTGTAAPTLTISSVNANGFTVAWTPVPEAEKYSVWIEPGTVNSGGLSAATTTYTFAAGEPSSSYTVKLDVFVKGTWTTLATTTATTTPTTTTP